MDCSVIHKILNGGVEFYTVDSVSVWLGYSGFEGLRERFAGNIPLRQPDDYLRLAQQWAFTRAGLSKIYAEACRLPEGRRIQERLSAVLEIVPPPPPPVAETPEGYQYLDDPMQRLEWELADIDEKIVCVKQKIADAIGLPKYQHVSTQAGVDIARLKIQRQLINNLIHRAWKDDEKRKLLESKP